MSTPRILGNYLEWRRHNVPGKAKALTQQEVLLPTHKHQTNVSKYENLSGYPSRQLISLISNNLKVEPEVLWEIVSLAKLNNIPPKDCVLSDEDIARMEGITPGAQLPTDKSVWEKAPVLSIEDINQKYYLSKLNELPSYFVLEDHAGNRNYCFHNVTTKSKKTDYTTDKDGSVHYISEIRSDYRK